MHDSLLTRLRCPFCGGGLSLVDSGATLRRGADIDAGVLGCACSAFPVVAGIPVLIADETTRDAMHALEAQRNNAALLTLLGLSGARADRFSALLARGGETTYRDALDILSPDAEGTYFFYRLSDPTFLTAEALVRAIVQPDTPCTGPVLDLCGGSGHLTRVLDGLGSGDTVVADRYFWKLWLATQFTAPETSAVCCDAESPLPFVRDLFSLVVLADAFPYIWHKRLCAEEMMRVSTPTSVIIMPHLHSALGDNSSAGATLPPAAYQALFAPQAPRLFSDTRLFDDLLDRRVVDLSQQRSPADLGNTPTVTLVACRQPQIFRRVDLPDSPLQGALVVNPLFDMTHRDGRSILTLKFPSPEYEAEFAACRRYLPDSLSVDDDLRGHLDPGSRNDRFEALRRQRVLIDVPPRYF